MDKDIVLPAVKHSFEEECTIGIKVLGVKFIVHYRPSDMFLDGRQLWEWVEHRFEIISKQGKPNPLSSKKERLSFFKDGKELKNYDSVEDFLYPYLKAILAGNKKRWLEYISDKQQQKLF